jgi:hypothetical protein
MYAGQFGMPGVSAALTTYDAELFWGGDESRIPIIRASGVISSTAADAGNTPTTLIRKGMLLGKIASTGELKQWNPDGSDGSQYLHSVLPVEQYMVDGAGTAVDRFGPVILCAPLKASALLIEGTALVGSTDEYLARQELAEHGCMLDDDPQGWKAGVNRRYITKSTDYTVVAGDNGGIFLADTANATFTLPAIKPGLVFDFIRCSDHNLVVASAEGDNVIVGNDLSADSITFSTASNKIGARVRVTGIYLGATPKWLAEIIAAPFSTGAFLTQTLAT